jgi:putative transposase
VPVGRGVTSRYYEWRGRPASATAMRRAHLAALVKAVFEYSDQTYGYRRVHAQLVRQGKQVSPELVRELMRELDLVACQPRPYRPTTTVPGDPGPIPDLVHRDFTAPAPGQKMVGDITYIPTWEGWVYFATVIDCHTKACIGYAMADHLRQTFSPDGQCMTLSPVGLWASGGGRSGRRVRWVRVVRASRVGRSARRVAP